MLNLYSKTLMLRFIYSLHKTYESGPFTRSKRLYNTIVIYTKGSHTFKLSDGRIMALKEGEVLYIPQNASYINYPSRPDMEFYHVDFRIWDADKEVPLFDDWTIFDNKQSHKLLPIFEKIYNAYSSNQPFSNLLCQELTCQLIRQLCKMKYAELSTSHSFVQIEQVAAYISENYAKDTPVTELAERASMSVSSLERSFQKYLNLSPIAYRNSIRIERAKLLLTKGLSVSEIAITVGFSDIYYFSRTFKQFVGVSPSEYAKLNTL